MKKSIREISSYPSYYNIDGTWISAETTPIDSTYINTAYLPKEIQPLEDKSEINEEAERKAIMKYNGFYIARYETGEENGETVSKQGVEVYSNKS